jgi:hypothetical protein
LSTLELYDVEDWTIHAAEIRLREDRLALSPKGKRDQRFRILFGVGKEATRERTPGDVNVISMDERRKASAAGARRVSNPLLIKFPVTFTTLGWTVIDWIESYLVHGPGDIQGCL